MGSEAEMYSFYQDHFLVENCEVDMQNETGTFNVDGILHDGEGMHDILTEPEFYMDCKVVQDMFVIRERSVADVLRREGTTFRVISTNIDILTNKMDEFLVFVASEDPDIICVQEIFPKNSLCEVDVDTAFKIDGYVMYYPSSMKRGVLTYVKAELSVLEIFPTIEFEESVWIQLSLKNAKSLLVGNIYRSPNSSIENNTSLCLLINEMCVRTEMSAVDLW